MDAPGFKYQNWFSDLSWKGQLSIDDCSLFSVYFEGVLCEDGSIASTDKSPLRVYAKRQGYNEKIVLFDEELYGYTPLLIEKVEYFQKSKIKKYKSLERFLLIDYKVIIKWIPIPIRHFFFFIIYTYKGQARFLCLSN